MMGLGQDKINGYKLALMMREMAAGQMGMMDTDKNVRLSRAEFDNAFAKMLEGIVADAKQKHNGG